ncbi:MAG: helix-turn-helix transcriptional regulator [Bacilli bacterium]|nr:helix-turn-helix transcriptional regulator [Bacilli bacterium]MBN2877716.1 helix-turn-helix transcriptional regulator [Bacilli bacterium]
MDFNLQLKIIKRREELYDFYYRGMGEKIKRTRIDQSLTQEALAKGICSNTYISKIENNKIAANKEQLYMLMERMGIETDRIGFPEMMVESLERSYEYFFFKDISSYEKLIQELDEYDYGVLIFVVRLGYFVLKGEYHKAKQIYDDMYRYIDTLEEYGFAIFMMYGCFYNVGIHDYISARLMYESISDKLRNNEPLYALYSYLRFIIYGNLHLFNKSREGLAVAADIFFHHNNCSRLMESMMYSNLFKIYENSGEEMFVRDKMIDQLMPNQRNLYLIMLSEVAPEPLRYLDQLHEESPYYLDGLFLKALFFLNTKDKENYRKHKQLLSDMHYQLDAKIDYVNLLRLIEQKETMFLKDYLANYMLPYTESLQNLYFYKKIADRISDILQSKNQYKNALIYRVKTEDFKKKMILSNKKTS